MDFIFKVFIKNHSDTMDPKVRKRYGFLAGIVGIISNLLLFIMKITVGIFSGSIAITADAVNNLTDASSSVITLFGFKLAAAPEDKDHPYGHARIEYLAGLLISVFIIFIGLQLLKTSLIKIFDHEPLHFTYTVAAILVISIFIKLLQALFNIKAGKKINSPALIAIAADSRNDVMATTAVLASLIVGELTGFNIDGYVGAAAAILIIWSGIVLVKQSASPLLGEAPDPEMVEAIKEVVHSEPSVLGMHDLIIHNYGPGKFFASLHIEVDANEDLMKSHDMIDNIERMVKEKLDIEFTAHMDPVKTDDPLIKKMHRIISDALDPIEGIKDIHDFRIVAGPTHTNIIFEIVLTSECRLKECEIHAIAETAAKNQDENYYVVITFDKAYLA